MCFFFVILLISIIQMFNNFNFKYNFILEFYEEDELTIFFSFSSKNFPTRVLFSSISNS